MKAQELRIAFLDFFKGKDHRIFPSDSLVPKEDPSLLFTSAGMNQFKSYFLGIKKDVRRAASIQKCLRTGDLERVGRTAAHHTFFEMLGNFSFGDYFKKEAIEYAWEFLTRTLNIPEHKLWISVYKDDSEAFYLWKDHINIPEPRIVKLGDSENFWPANVVSEGPDGPCGPCSEIYFDRGTQEDCPDPRSCNPACSCKRFVEVWNLVFTEYNCARGQLKELPSKNIDTGMGLERLCSVLQDVDTNFKTDVFKPLMARIRLALDQKEDKPSIYVIADHFRAVFFAIGDGVLPSNEDRGYVIRKLIRRAFWAGHELAGIKKPFLYELGSALRESMGIFYKENFVRSEDVEKVIFSEEEKFLSTMETGNRILLESIEKTRQARQDSLSGETVFKLYDTYGFPVDLTENIARQAGLNINKDGFNRLMTKQKESSKKSSKFEENIFSRTIPTGNLSSVFAGYAQDSLLTSLIGIVRLDSLVERIAEAETGGLILRESVFYPEAGGQLSDKGTISKDGAIFAVEKTLKLNNCIVCLGEVRQGYFAVGDPVRAEVDLARRNALKRAHTSTHLLQAALRKCLGAHVRQQGSRVDEDSLRFDFNHFRRLNPEELTIIEQTVNSYIFDADRVFKKEMSLKEAQEKNALAFFQEKYEEQVRVVSAGDYSSELCGGLHLENTAQVGLFKIVSEGSVASGIRRIEALCGKRAYEDFVAESRSLREITTELRATRETTVEMVRKQMSRLEQLEKAARSNERMLQETKLAEALHDKNRAVGEIFVLVHKTEEEAENLGHSLEVLARKSLGQPQVLFLFSQAPTEAQAGYICSLNPEAREKGADCSRLMDKIFAKFPGKGSRKIEFSRGVIARPGLDEEELRKIAGEYIHELGKK